ncbi:DUF2066 domain-containing protein [Pseudomonas sp. NA-150]|uniref:DUF2066 domain-containing protein n=1 Tax=Pseudomonas sp. NA-150 TaxID=3367525 RepID=UPI0037CAB322
MRLSKFLFAGCLSLLSLPSFAETVTHLYQVRETVSGQTPDERTQATQRALDTMILRLTGDVKALQSPGLAEVRKDPQQIISKYGYEAGPPESLLVDFDPASTDAVLRKAGMPLWGTNRPAILGWWLNDTTEGSNLVGDGQATAAPLKRAAQHRGLPLRLPLADLGEQGIGSAKTLDGSDPTPLKAASERYGADALLAVHAHEENGQWQATWHIWLGNQHEQGSATGADSAALADAVMLAVSERLAPRFVVKAGASSGLVLNVQGMSLEHYAQLGRLLDPFGAKLKTVDGDRVTYEVNANADQLRSQLSLAKLQEVPAAEVAAPVVAAQPPAAPGAAPVVQPPSLPQLNFRW